MGLEGTVDAACGIATPGINLHDRPRGVSRGVGKALALAKRLLVHPGDNAIALDPQQLAAQIHIATIPASAGADLAYHLASSTLERK
jgi:hypothetical protein